MTAEDRIALILGRAIMRAEALAAELERLKLDLALEEREEPEDAPQSRIP